MNRIQRVRRFRLATLGLSLVTLLTVSLPAAAPVLAAPGDTLKVTVGGSATYAAGPAGSTFTARIASNTVTQMGGIQASLTFDNTVLSVQSITRVSGFWGSASLPVDGSNVATSNANGKVGGWAAAYISTPGSPVSTDVPFLDVVFRVISCPAGGAAGTLGLPVGPADGAFNEAATGDPVTPQVTQTTVTCTPPAANEFSLTASPASLTVPQGGTAQANLTAALTSGVAEAVTLGASGVPADVTATFTPTSVTPTGGSQVTFAVGATAVVGTYTVTITGTAASATRTADISLTITPPPAGPVPVSGQVVVSGTVDAGFLGVTVSPNTFLRLRRNAPNETTVPVLIFSNTQWTLSVQDAMLGGKAAADRGHMLDTGASPVKRLDAAMTAFVQAPTPLVRTLDVAGPQSLVSGALGGTVNVTLAQLTKPIDPPGNYAIDLTFSAISGF